MPFDMTSSNVTFNAEIKPLYDESGNEIDPSIARGVYRQDTNEAIAACGPSTHLIQHHQILNPVLNALADLDFKLEERSVNRDNLYDLQGKKGAWIQYETTDNGALMRSTIITGDFINPTGSTTYLDQGPDVNFFRIRVLNSHNGKFAARVDFDYLRLLCMNGMTSTVYGANLYGKHTAGFKIEGMQAKIESAINNMHTDADRFGLYATTPLTYEEASVFLRATIAKKLPVKWERMAKRREVSDKHDKIMTLFEQESQTVWGLYNAMTAWQTHGEMMQNTNSITGRISRESTIRKALNAPQWHQLMAA